MDNYTIELIKQVGAVGFIAILLIRQNGKNYDRLFKTIQFNFNKLFDKVDDIFHKQKNTLLTNSEIEREFDKAGNIHKILKWDFISEYWDCINRDTIDIDCIYDDIQRKFKIIARSRENELNELKSDCFKMDLGTKAYKTMDWKSYITGTVYLLLNSATKQEFKSKFQDLADENQSKIKAKLKI